MSPNLPDPAIVAQRWATAMGAATTQQNYKAGTANPKQDPMKAAATPKAMEDYAAGCANSVANGRRLKGLGKRTLQYWQQMCAQKGASRLGTGAQAAMPAYQAAIQALLPVYQQIRGQLATMPKGGLANAQARAGVAIAALMQYAGTA